MFSDLQLLQFGSYRLKTITTGLRSGKDIMVLVQRNQILPLL